MTASHRLSLFLMVPALAIPACQEPTAESIVARAGEAMMASGGVADLTTLRIHTVFPDHEYPVITELRRPDHIRTEGVDNYVLVFDGEHAAFLEQPPAADGTRGEPELIDPAYLRDLELDIAFVFPAFFDHPAEYLGPDSADGVMTEKLRVVLPLGIPVTYHLDADTWLIHRITADVTVDDMEFHPERVFSDYENMGGVMYARTFTYSWQPEVVETASVESLEVNVPLGDERFAIPDSLILSGPERAQSTAPDSASAMSP